MNIFFHIFIICTFDKAKTKIGILNNHINCKGQVESLRKWQKYLTKHFKT